MTDLITRGRDHFRWLAESAADNGKSAALFALLCDEEYATADHSAYPDSDAFEYLREAWNEGWSAGAREWVEEYLAAQRDVFVPTPAQRASLSIPD